jgi:hypothetical protein
MMLIVPPENQGQIVEVAYGWHEGRLYRRTHDRSDRTTCWEVADEDEAADLDETWDPVNGAPAVKTWSDCQDPEP